MSEPAVMSSQPKCAVMHIKLPLRKYKVQVLQFCSCFNHLVLFAYLFCIVSLLWLREELNEISLGENENSVGKWSKRERDDCSGTSRCGQQDSYCSIFSTNSPSSHFRYSQTLQPPSYVTLKVCDVNQMVKPPTHFLTIVTPEDERGLSEQQCLLQQDLEL